MVGLVGKLETEKPLAPLGRRSEVSPLERFLLGGAGGGGVQPFAHHTLLLSLLATLWLRRVSLDDPCSTLFGMGALLLCVRADCEATAPSSEMWKVGTGVVRIASLASASLPANPAFNDEADGAILARKGFLKPGLGEDRRSSKVC